MSETALSRLRAMTSGYSQSRAIQVMADLGLTIKLGSGVAAAQEVYRRSHDEQRAAA